MASLSGMVWLSFLPASLMVLKASGLQSVPLLPPARSGHCQAPTPKSASLSTAGFPQALHCCPFSLPPLPLHLGGHEALRQLREQSPRARAEIRHLHPGSAPGTRGCKCCLLSLAFFRCLCPSVPITDQRQQPLLRELPAVLVPSWHSP